ncbi:MAG: redox-sensing transcriptional repressor Rex [Acutalibacteraceae bacterium]|jgi:redox-sensing transcriptional repressor|nr:redox-sensing transcriptional repressor Rex [Acutalibacteraceae bacterium]
MSSKYVSSSVIKRLPRYYRFLSHLQKEGMVRISSRELAQRMGLSASQIRQDLNNFGGFGQQGYGYNIASLYKEIGKILGVDSGFKTVLIGAGNLGHTIATQMDFKALGFDLIGIFDRKETLAGQMIKGIPVRDAEELEDFCKENQVDVAVLCVPYDSAEKLVDILIPCGVRGYWNFSHYNISEKYPDVSCENVHLNDSLMTLCYQVLNRTNFGES